MKDRRVEIVYRPIAQLVPYAANARTHTKAQVEQIAASIREFGWTNPVLIDEADGIIAGHGRVLAGKLLNLEQAPCIVLAGLSEAQRAAYVIADNQLAMNAGWDFALLKAEVEKLQAASFDVSKLGFSAEELDLIIRGPGRLPQINSGLLAERFGVPPFSVLSARDGWWQERKRAWIGLGIKSEIGRGDALIF